MNAFDDSSMRKRFHDLGKEREKLLAPLDKARAERDKLVAEHEAKIKPLENKIKELSTPIFDIDQERSKLAKALKGQTGKPE